MQFKRVIWVISVLFSATTAEVIQQEDFETDGSGTRYFTSVAEFTDGNADFFTRTDGSNLNPNYVVSNVTGSYFFAAMDVDGQGGPNPVSIESADIPIAGFSNLRFSGFFAESNAFFDTNEDFDLGDLVTVEVSIDNQPYTPILAFAGEAGGTNFNNLPRQDTDFDGVGDGAELTSSFSEFNEPITGTGNTLKWRITVNLNSGDEDISFDNLAILGDAAPVSVVVESAHPHASNTNEKWTVVIPGATCYAISMDSQSWTRTSSDLVKIFAVTSNQGEVVKTLVGGKPLFKKRLVDFAPVEVTADSLVVTFVSGAAARQGWGFRLNVDTCSS